MILLRLCRNILLRLLVALVIISSLVIPPAFCQETEDSQVFIAGFNAYQQKDYATSIEKMNEVLQKYPDTPLRDMALFWLSRSYFKAGNQQEAARYLTQFSKEYPDNPLKSTVEDELLSLAARYEKGEKLPSGPTPTKQPDRQAAQKAKTEKERIAAAKAEEAKRAAAAAETARVAALKQAEENAAAEKREKERLAAVKAEQEKIAAAKAEEMRKAAALAEQQRVEAAKAEQAKLAAATAAAEESARIAALKQADEKAAAEKREQERTAAAKAEQERIIREAAAREKSEQQRIAAIKDEEARKAAEQAELQRIAAQKAEQDKMAAVAAESARSAAAKQAEERAAAEKKELERSAAVKAEQERIEAARAEEAKLAEAAKAEQERIARAKAEEKLSAEAAAEAARIAAQRTEREQIARAKAEEAQQAVAAAEAARLASLKAEEERRAAERTAKEAEASRLAALKAEEARLAEQKLAEDKIKAAKLSYREKAIGQYKAIIDKFPTSAAAVTAAAKLRELGVAVALPVKPVEAPLPENAQILRLEVAQFAGFEFNLLARPEAFPVGRPVSVPFEVINRGNGTDSFYLESAFPAEFKTRFASAAAPGTAISQTPELAPGETFKGNIDFVIPPSSIDGMRFTHPVKVASRLMTEASQSREVRLVASAPLLRAVLRSDKAKPLPGEKILYRVAVLNVGSTAAEDVTFRLNFPPQLEPVDYAVAGFRQEMKSALVFDGLQVKSGESREFSVAFQLKDDSIAGQELSTRAELNNNSLNTAASFVSNMAYVEAQRNISVRSGSDRLVAIPGQTLSVPFIVTNTGNVREKFAITSAVAGAQDAVIFNDLNRDGLRQASEPIITEIGPLAPREEASVVVEIKTPGSAADGSQGNVRISFASEGNSALSVSGSTQLTYSRPVLKMVMSGRDGRLKPGDVASFDLTITNNGSNLARVVELQSAWPAQLELVAADPATNSVSNETITWRFKELGAGEKRSIKVSFRVKPGTSVGTAIQVKNTLSYEDQLGNRY